MERLRGRHDDQKQLFDRILARAKTIPGVSDATWALGVPPLTAVSVGIINVDGGPNQRRAAFLGVNMVTPDYFRVTGPRIIEGRAFDASRMFEEDVMVSASLARRYWPNESAVGKRLRLGPDMPWSTIVGVVNDVTIPRPGASLSGRDTVYSPLGASFGEGLLVIRGTPSLSGLLPALVSAAADIDQSLRVKNVEVVETSVAASQALPRFIAGVLAAFSVMSVLLAAVGLYGVIAHTVTRRWSEMGIRRALGARTSEVLRPVFVEGGLVISVGLTAGLAGAAAATRGLRGLLFQVEPVDVATFALAGMALAVISVAAVYFPARRATRIDPAMVLREE